MKALLCRSWLWIGLADWALILAVVVAVVLS
jgi:hypothetical protein